MKPHDSSNIARTATQDAVTRPIPLDVHPLENGNYRVATPAIEAFYELVQRCLRYRVPGALIHGPSRFGKTRAIEYLRLLLAQTYPKISTYHVQAEHKPRHAEGPFLSTLLDAVGDPRPDGGANPSKRLRLINRMKEACGRNGAGVVILFCDEAQRYELNEYEWLRDVHDHLDRLQIRLFTFLVGQQELRAVKTNLQHARQTQIVARLMVEELAFFGIRNVQDVATCLHSYDATVYPRDSDWSFTRFYVPLAFAAGYRLADQAADLWGAFERTYHAHGLASDMAIPMESFARTVEIVLKESWLRDAPDYRPDVELWRVAARSSGFLQTRMAIGQALSAPDARL